MKFPEPLQKLITFLRKFPGVGRRTAERFAFQILSWSDEEISNFASHLSTLKEKLQGCETCGALIERNTCTLCDFGRRDQTLLCVVSSPKDIFSLEATGIYNGLYHVVSGLLSPIDGLDPSDIQFERLQKRVTESEIKEIILAFDSTVEGDATALFLKREIEKEGLITSRLALGMPVGSTLDFIDEGTLSRAFSSRHPL